VHLKTAQVHFIYFARDRINYASFSKEKLVAEFCLISIFYVKQKRCRYMQETNVHGCKGLFLICNECMLLFQLFKKLFICLTTVHAQSPFCFSFSCDSPVTCAEEIVPFFFFCFICQRSYWIACICVRSRRLAKDGVESISVALCPHGDFWNL
jgi:hypothetical protein